MSIREMTRIWDLSDLDTKTSYRLLALADYANDDGMCFPGTEKLAVRWRTTERNVPRATKLLVAQGLIYKRQGGGKGISNRYVILAGLSRQDAIERLMKVFKVKEVEAEQMLPPAFVGQGEIPDYTLTPDVRVSETPNPDISGQYPDKTGTPNPDISGQYPDTIESGEPLKEPSIKEPSIEPVADWRPQSPIDALSFLCFGASTSDLDERNKMRVIVTLHGRKKGSRAQQKAGLAEFRDRNGLLFQEITTEMIDREFRFWWYAVDWRGQRDQKPPPPSQVRDCWRPFAHWRKNGYQHQIADVEAQIPDWYQLSIDDPAELVRRIKALAAPQQQNPDVPEGMMQTRNPKAHHPPVPKAKVHHVNLANIPPLPSRAK